MSTYYVYMMASHTKVIYIGVTNDIVVRVQQHKAAPPTTFTGKYNVNRLVWYEDYPDIRDAIAREKQLKGWRRSKKVALIEAANAGWIDISYRWFHTGAADPGGDPSTALGMTLAGARDDRSPPG